MAVTPEQVSVGISGHGMHDEFGLIPALSWLHRHGRALLVVPGIAALISTGAVFVIPSRYESTAVILPEIRGSARIPSGLAGLAGQFGFSVPNQAGYSPAFYAEAAASRNLLVGLLRRGFPPNSSASGTRTLLDWLHVSGRTDERRLDNGVRKLKKRIRATVNIKSGTVTLAFESPNPELSRQVLDTLLADLNRFNLETRRSQAALTSKFLGERTDSAKQDLRAAEQELQRFYESNRSWESAPALRFEESRLRRHVEVDEQLYLGLIREYDAARVDEFNNVPVFTIVDPPFVPKRRSFPNRTVTVVFVTVLVLFGTGTWFVFSEYLRAVTEAETDMAIDLPAWLWRWLRRARRSRQG